MRRVNFSEGIEAGFEPYVVDDGVLEPRHSKVEAFGVDFLLDAAYPIEHDRPVATVD